jgi:hypothetical protein
VDWIAKAKAGDSFIGLRVTRVNGTVEHLGTVAGPIPWWAKAAAWWRTKRANARLVRRHTDDVFVLLPAGQYNPKEFMERVALILNRMRKDGSPEWRVAYDSVGEVVEVALKEE